VLVLQKQGVGPWPAWHYAVVVGYDAQRGTVTLRSGTQPRLELRAPVFEATWSRADRWSIVALEPGQLPARPNLERYMQGAASLEAVGQLEAAHAAYAAGAEQWPDEPLPRLGLANIAATQGRWQEAERAYAEVLRLDPRSSAALNNRAEALTRLGCHHAALSLLEQGAARLDPDDPLRPTLARTLGQIGAAAAAAAGWDPASCQAFAGP
jgi:tetratricopeptide (TPR) repeat protein